MKNKHQLVWGVILFGALAVLIVYSSGLFLLAKNAGTDVYTQGFYNSGMMGGRVNSNQNSSGEKLTPDQILSDVENYLKGYGNNLQVADILSSPMRITTFRWKRKIPAEGPWNSWSILIRDKSTPSRVPT